MNILMRLSDTPWHDKLNYFLNLWCLELFQLNLNLLVHFIIRWLHRQVELHVTTYMLTLPVPSVTISLNYCKMGTK